MDPYPRTWAEIDLVALKHNLEVVRSEFGAENKLALVCKADAYGHGLVPTGRFAVKNGADWLAVATVQEGVALRDAGVEAPIMVMSPILEVEVDQAAFYGLHIFVESVEMAQLFGTAAARMNKTALLHLKVDTGLHRFGCPLDQALAIAQQIIQIPNVELTGLAHHFIDSAFDPGTTNKQREAFNRLVADFHAHNIAPAYIHESNSAGVLFPHEHRNLARIGIFAYGVDPANLLKGKLKPVMTWKARVTSVHTPPKGDTVSYSSTFRLERDSVVATLGVGYGDGYMRALSNKGFVWLNGHRCPVIGLVCMDQMMVDATDLPNVKPGDTAELVGPNAPASELARLASTNSHEIICRVMSRVSRRYHYPD